jgi:two-component system chemotaxis response regulator CheB
MAPETNATDRIQVLVVDDSAVVRQVMYAVLSQEPDMSITVAADPLIAMQKMKQMRPHVILLDLEMPRMDGLTFLRKIMAEDPIPTLVCSGVAGQSTQAALRALNEGAVAIVTKPKLGVRDFLHESAGMLIDMVRSAAHSRMRRRASIPQGHVPAASAIRRGRPVRATAVPQVVAIGASTGGTEALAEILAALPPDAPGIVIVQHMPELFTAAFANRLNDLCQLHVKEAEHGDSILPGHALIAPGNRHISVKRAGPKYTVSVDNGPLVSRHRPSVDLLFRSVAQAVGPNSLGVILTGMGNDGALGLLEMQRSGARTIAQDENSCVVFGMPKEAIKAGAVDLIAPLALIAELIVNGG